MSKLSRQRSRRHKNGRIKKARRLAWGREAAALSRGVWNRWYT